MPLPDDPSFQPQQHPGTRVEENKHHQRRHLHPLRSYPPSEVIMAESQAGPPLDFRPISFDRFESSENNRPPLSPTGSQRDLFDIVTPLAQIPPAVVATSEGLGNSPSPRTDASDFPVIPMRPPLRPTVSFCGVSRISYFSQDSPHKKGFELSVEDIEPERVSSSPRRPNWRFYISFGCIVLTNFMSDVSVAGLCVSLPSVAQDLGLTAVESFWVSGSFLLSATIMQPLFVRLSPALGCKPLVLFGLVLFTAGNIASALGKDATTLIAGRSIEGVGAGAITMLTNLTLSQLSFAEGLDGRAAKTYDRLVVQASWLGLALGPIIGSTITNGFGWRSIFWLQIHFSVISLVVLTFTRIPYIEAGPVLERLRRIDYLGWLMLACSIFSTMVPISRTGTLLSWSSWHTILPIVLGLVGFAGWCWYNTYRIDPILPVSIFRSKSALVSCFGTLVHGALLTTLIYLLPIVFALQRSSLVMASLSLSSWTFTLFLASTLCIYATTLTGHLRPIWIAWALTAITFGLMLLFNPATPTTFWIPLGLSTGLALGILASSLSTAIQSAASNDDETIHSTSLHVFFSTLGRGIGLLIGSSIFLNGLEREMQSTAPWHANAQLVLEHAISFLHAFYTMGPEHDDLRESLATAYTYSLRHVWLAGCIVSAVMFVLSIWFTKDHRPQPRGNVADPEG